MKGVFKAMTIKKPGDDFRGAVASLFRARYGAAEVQEEVKLESGKNADIVFQFTKMPGVKETVAVECKDLKKSLNSTDLRNIIRDYDADIRNKNIDHLYIIAKKDIEANPRNTLKSYRSVTFLTISQLESSILDFGPYIRSLIEDYDDSDLSNYYIPSHTTENQQLHNDIILPWLESQDQHEPISIMAGYGMGKTSYSKYLAREIAIKCLNDPENLIPIKIELGEVFKQQSIRSLISYMFADLYKIEGYNYNLFDNLNKNGRFLLIFDAFDEMKHAMRERDILLNLKDICSLIYPKTKAILLGRPDVFVSQTEQANIRGEKKIIGRLYRSEELRKFDTYQIRFLSIPESLTLIEEFIRFANSKQSMGIKNVKKFVDKRIDEINKKTNVKELLSRPVQAKMVAELLCSNPENKELYDTAYQLYFHFIDQIMERELEKFARLEVEKEQRLRFMRHVAWWLWMNHDGQYFFVEDLPHEIKKIAGQGKGVPHEGVIREYLVGSVLEKRSGSVMSQKGDNYFYFSHNSYWEFLVASYLCEENLLPQDLYRLNERINEQILQFLVGSPTAEPLDKLYEAIVRYDGTLNFRILEACAISGIAEEYAENWEKIWQDNTLFRTGPSFIIDSIVFSLKFSNRPELWEHYYVSAFEEYPEYANYIMLGILYWLAKCNDEVKKQLASLVLGLGGRAVLRCATHELVGEDEVDKTHFLWIVQNAVTVEHDIAGKSGDAVFDFNIGVVFDYLRELMGSKVDWSKFGPETRSEIQIEGSMINDREEYLHDADLASLVQYGASELNRVFEDVGDDNVDFE